MQLIEWTCENEECKKQFFIDIDNSNRRCPYCKQEINNLNWYDYLNDLAYFEKVE